MTAAKTEFILNKFKTDKGGTLDVRFKLTKSKDHKALNKLIKDWIKLKKIKVGDFFLGGKGGILSMAVGAMNKRVGVPGAINTLRQMAVSTLGADAPFAQREALAKTMSHSVFTAPKYQVNLDKSANKLGRRTKTV